MSAQEEATPIPPPRKRRRMTRILLRAVAAIAIILVLLIVAVQVVLSTDLPRRVLVDQAQKALGLRIEVKSFSSGWWGHSRLKGVSVWLPLADHPFLTIPQVDVEHTSLVMILLSRSVSIDRIAVDRPVVEVVQGKAGQWNLQRVAGLLTSPDQSPSQPGSTSGPPQLPAILIHQATINVTDQRGRHATITPVNVSGKSTSPLTYALSVDSPDHLRLDGKIALNRTLHQQMTLDVQSVGQWVHPWAEIPPITLRAYWDGTVESNGLSGKLTLSPLQVGSRLLSGTTEIEARGGALDIQPDTLRIDTAMPDGFQQVVLRSGRITLGKGHITLQRLLASAADGLVQLDGQSDLSFGSASISALWQDLHLPADIHTSGSAHATLHTPLPGQPVIKLTLEANGDSPQGTWKTSANINGSGPSYSAMSWTVRSDAFTLDRGSAKPPLVITDFLAHIAGGNNVIALTDLSLRAPAELRGSGAYDFAQGKWWLWINSTGWPIDHDDTFGFDINAWGNRQYATLHQLYAHAGEAELVATGYYGHDWPKPLWLHVYAGHSQADLMSHPQSGDIRGRLRGYADAEGKLSPLALSLTGQLRGRRLVVYGRDIDDIDAIWNGTLSGERTDVHGHMKLAGGQWSLEGIYPDKSTFTGWWRQSGRLSVKADDVDLAQVGKMLNVPDLSGSLQGHWTFELPSLALDKILMAGEVNAANVSAAGQQFESASARMVLARGVFRVWNGLIKQAGNPGQLRGTAWIDLNDPVSVQSRFKVGNWIARSADQRMQVVLNAAGGENAASPLKYNISSRTADGEIDARADLSLDGRHAGQAAINIALRSDDEPPTTRPVVVAPPVRLAAGQIVEMTRLDANVLGGSIAGRMSAHVPSLASAADPWMWNHITGIMHGQGIALSDLSHWSDAALLHRLGGKLTFKATARPTTQPHPIEPQYINLAMNIDGGHLGEMKLSAAQFHMYLGHERLVFAPDAGRQSIISLAGGAIYPWLRVSRHEGAGYFALLDGRFENLDLNQLLHAGGDESRPMPGLLAGRFNFQGNLNRPKAINGSAKVRITDSDLVNFKPLTLLYDLLNVGGKPKSPIGNGRLDVSLQQSQLAITNAHYFNRGIDAIGSITLDDVWDIKNSPIQGGVVGTARPLKDIKLPLVSDADQLLSSLQSFLTAVGIKGTVSKPHVYQTSLNTFGGNFLKALLGDVKDAKSQ